MKKPSIKSLRKKADRLFQEIGRKIYKECEVCGAPMSCLHHFFTKGSSSYLRYVWNNAIPICQSCHVKIELRKAHELTGRIVLKRGDKWLYDLVRLQHKYVKTDRFYYQDIIKNLELILKGGSTPYKPL